MSRGRWTPSYCFDLAAACLGVGGAVAYVGMIIWTFRRLCLSFVEGG